jgi:hypothetical protein
MRVEYTADRVDELVLAEGGKVIETPDEKDGGRILRC